MNKSTITKKLIIAHAAMASAFFLSQANAASQCKGLDNAACASSTQCSWVEGYERKDGRQVQSFCRTKAKKSVSKPKENNDLAENSVKTN